MHTWIQDSAFSKNRTLNTNTLGDCLTEVDISMGKTKLGGGNWEDLVPHEENDLPGKATLLERTIFTLKVIAMAY